MDGHHHWDWKARSISDVLWPSFLAASFATMVFFAMIDPESLLLAMVVPVDLSRIGVYSIGFFFFWLICSLSSLLTTWLIRTERKRADFPTE
jgi:hypothetical protein